MDLRSFTFGIMAGIAMIVGGFVAASQTQGIRWEAVKIERR